MTTTRQLITGAFRLINAVQANEEPTAEDMAIAQEALNALIDSESQNLLNIHEVTPYRFPLTPGQFLYTLGPTGDWQTERPMRIEQAKMMLNPIIYLPAPAPPLPPPPLTAIFLDTFTGTSTLAAHTPEVGGTWVDGWAQFGCEPASESEFWQVSGGVATYPVGLRVPGGAFGYGSVVNGPGPTTSDYPFTLSYTVNFATPVLGGATLAQTASVGFGEYFDWSELHMMIKLNANPGVVSIQARLANSVGQWSTTIPVEYDRDYVLTMVVHTPTTSTLYIDDGTWSVTHSGPTAHNDLPYVIIENELTSGVTGAVTTARYDRISVEPGEHPPT